jgi:ribosomal protein S3
VRYLKHTFFLFFLYFFSKLKIKGIKFSIKGKISVAGNARKKKIFFSFGKTSFSSLSNKILYNFTTITTFTGVLGVKI